VQYKVAGVLIGIGVALWVGTVLINRATRQDLAKGESTLRTRGPVN
jgi:hypothetical protein